MKRQKAIIVVVLVCMTVFLLSFSAFAIGTNNASSFPVASTTRMDVFYKTSTNQTCSCALTAANSNNIYVFAYGTHVVGACTTSIPSSQLTFRLYLNGSTASGDYITHLDSTSNLYYADVASGLGTDASLLTVNPSVPYFNSLQDGLNALRSYIDTPPEPVFDHTVSMYIQPGTMVRIKSPGNLTWNLETTFDYTCRKVNDNYMWLYNSCYYFVNPSAVGLGFNTASFVNDNYNNHLIPWLRMNPANLWGNTQNAKYAAVSALNGSYLYIYIPVSDYHDWDSWFAYGLFTKQSQNHPVLLECDNASEIVVYTMGEAVESGFIHGTTQSFYTYTEYGTFEGQDGSSVSTVTSDIELDPQTSTLDSLVSTIQSFFIGTWSHISSLVSSLGTFPNFVVQLYSWLPLEFRAVLLSAFSIAMVVGVLKVML